MLEEAGSIVLNKLQLFIFLCLRSGHIRFSGCYFKGVGRGIFKLLEFKKKLQVCPPRESK